MKYVLKGLKVSFKEAGKVDINAGLEEVMLEGNFEEVYETGIQIMKDLVPSLIELDLKGRNKAPMKSPLFGDDTSLTEEDSKDNNILELSFNYKETTDMEYEILTKNALKQLFNEDVSAVKINISKNPGSPSKSEEYKLRGGKVVNSFGDIISYVMVAKNKYDIIYRDIQDMLGIYNFRNEVSEEMVDKIVSIIDDKCGSTYLNEKNFRVSRNLDGTLNLIIDGKDSIIQPNVEKGILRSMVKAILLETFVEVADAEVIED